MKKNSDIIIRVADKGGGIVVQNRADYIGEAVRLLSDHNTYEVLSQDPLPQYKIELQELINKAFNSKIINKSEKLFFLNNYFKTPYFYHTPKIHKNPVCPPGRPIVAAMESITSSLSQYVDLHLQPIVTSLPAYIRDSTQVLEILQNYRWEPNYLWLSLDVCSLYTSIPHEGGLKAVEHFLSGAEYLNPDQSGFISACTQFALERNYFEFQGKHYRQISGTAMGAHFAPCYANLFMGFWEKFHIWMQNPFAQHLVYYGRYIDDVIVIWDGSADRAVDFVNYCNTNPYGIRFTHVLDAKSLVFLDLELTWNEEGAITSKTHFKETAGNSYLHWKSCHLPKWKENIPYSQFCRLRRNCTDTEQYLLQAKILEKKFMEKGYAVQHIQKARDRYIEGCSSKAAVENGAPREVMFITKFNNQHWAIKRALQKHWPILQQDAALGRVLPKKPKVVFRRASNVKSLVAPSKIKSMKCHNRASNIPVLFNMVGFNKCKQSRCKACAFMQHGKSSFTSVAGHTYNIKQFISCGTQFVVYGLRCPCGLIYVGRTVRAMRTRFGEHRRFIEQKKDKHSVPRHFCKAHGGDTAGLELFGIEAISMTLPEGERFAILCKQETFWIFTLGSMSPGGLNEELEVNTII